MTIINRPVPFQGPAEDRRFNYASHHWLCEGDPEDGDVRCMRCDSKPWHKAADYPCGVDVPREWVCSDCMQGIKHEHTAEEAACLRGEVPA